MTTSEIAVPRAAERRRSALPRKLLSVAVSVVLTFFGLTVVTFMIGRVIPIDPVVAILGDRAPPEAYERLRHQLYLDRPLIEQYVIYAGQVLRGDFGNSVISAKPVVEDLERVFPATLELSTTATLIGVLIGVPLGIFAAVNQGRLIDHVVRVVGLIGYSVPVFWLGLVGLLVFYVQLGWVGGPGRLDVFYDGVAPEVTGIVLVDAMLAGEWDVFWNGVQHLMLPASLLGYLSLAYIARMTRSLMLDQLRQEYITAARVKGASEARIIWRHALGNVLVPLITVIALSYASLLEGTILTETVFAWPGVGLYITSSLFSADMNAVLGGTMLIGTVFIALNLLTDLLYQVVDPRARDVR
ncbi:MAG: ABC transporter permease [Alphaproteobacteria bacterium]|nr:ABC transporter permease [Alphaproteobacteria bacterium]